jgi:hypothetical protein
VFGDVVQCVLEDHASPVEFFAALFETGEGHEKVFDVGILLQLVHRTNKHSAGIVCKRENEKESQEK